MCPGTDRTGLNKAWRHHRNAGSVLGDICHVSGTATALFRYLMFCPTRLKKIVGTPRNSRRRSFSRPPSVLPSPSDALRCRCSGSPFENIECEARSRSLSVPIARWASARVLLATGRDRYQMSRACPSEGMRGKKFQGCGQPPEPPVLSHSAPLRPLRLAQPPDPSETVNPRPRAGARRSITPTRHSTAVSSSRRRSLQPVPVLFSPLRLPARAGHQRGDGRHARQDATSDPGRCSLSPYHPLSDGTAPHNRI
jgi:hypothetical protein